MTDILKRTWMGFQARKFFFGLKIEAAHFSAKHRLKMVSLNLAIYIYHLDHLRKTPT